MIWQLFLGLKICHTWPCSVETNRNQPQTKDWKRNRLLIWGNSLFLPNDTGLQFNSETERALDEIALSSSGIVLIEQAVRRDLAFMKEFAIVTVAVAQVAIDRIAIAIRIQIPDNLQRRDFIFIWDATRLELDVPSLNNSVSAAPGSQEGFDYLLNFAL